MTPVEWDRAHPLEKRERQRRYREHVWNEAVAAYGGKCVDCSCAVPRELEFDHANGNGNRH